jgi:hypothetical protein
MHLSIEGHSTPPFRTNPGAISIALKRDVPENAGGHGGETDPIFFCGGTFKWWPSVQGTNVHERSSRIRRTRAALSERSRAIKYMNQIGRPTGGRAAVGQRVVVGILRPKFLGSFENNHFSLKVLRRKYSITNSGASLAGISSDIHLEHQSKRY